jgi:hypothetical protein
MPSTIGEGPAAGNWPTASAVDRDCADGLVSSLVISVVVSRSTHWDHIGVSQASTIWLKARAERRCPRARLGERSEAVRDVSAGPSGRSAMIWQGARSGCLEHEVVRVGEVAVGGDRYWAARLVATRRTSTAQAKRRSMRRVSTFGEP